MGAIMTTIITHLVSLVLCVTGGIIVLVFALLFMLWISSHLALTIAYPILNSAIDEAFDIIYKNHLIVWINSRQTIDKNQYTRFEQQFVSLVYDQIGFGCKFIFFILYGNLSVLSLFLILTFRKRVDEHITSIPPASEA